MEKKELSDQIIQSNRVINRYLQQYNLDVWLDLQLTIAQIKSLFFLSDHTDVNFRTLAKALKVTPSNVTGIIDRLSEQGLVSREDNPQDRRMLMLKLTPKGDNLITKLRERRASQFLSVLNDLPEKDLQVINAGYGLLAEAIKQRFETD